MRSLNQIKFHRLFLLCFSTEWLPVIPTTRSCREKYPSWRNATCEFFDCFISNYPFLCNTLVIVMTHPDQKWFCCFAFRSLNPPPHPRLSFLWFLFLSLQVFNGATTQAASYGHEFIQQASSDWDMCAGTVILYSTSHLNIKHKHQQAGLTADNL